MMPMPNDEDVVKAKRPWTRGEKLQVVNTIGVYIIVGLLTALLISLERKSETIEATALSANTIMTDFQQTKILNTTKQVSLSYPKVANSLEFARQVLLEVGSLLLDVVRRINATGLIQRFINETGIALDEWDDLLQRVNGFFGRT